MKKVLFIALLSTISYNFAFGFAARHRPKTKIKSLVAKFGNLVAQLKADENDNEIEKNTKDFIRELKIYFNYFRLKNIGTDFDFDQKIIELEKIISLGVNLDKVITLDVDVLRRSLIDLDDNNSNCDLNERGLVEDPVLVPGINRVEIRNIDLILYSIYYGSGQILDLLLKNGATISQEAGITGHMHYALDAKDSKLIDTLLKYNADVNVKRHNGDTPLHMAVKCRHNFEGYCSRCLKIIEQLLPISDITLVDIQGKTAEEYCRSQSARELFNSQIRNRIEFIANTFEQFAFMPKPLVYIMGQYLFGEK